MPQDTDPDETPKGRRNFLNVATGSMGTVAIGAAGFGLTKSCTPDAAVEAGKWHSKVDLSDLAPGEQLTVKALNQPIFLLKLTDQQIEQALADAPADLPDPYARNANFAAVAPATLENRTVNFHGPIVVQIGLCTHLGCVPLGDSGDHGAWFCPCHAAHFDILGRVRKGPAPTNMAIPRFEVTEDGVMSFIEAGPAPIDDKSLDRLIYGESRESKASCEKAESHIAV